MAWRSSGTTNDEMVDNLKRFGVISTPAVEAAFRQVDRAFFVPPSEMERAHSDQPLREGNLHISAPHIYGSVLEALVLPSNSSLSFLNVGSGTGYLSCLVATLLGGRSNHYGVEILLDVVEHARTATRRWKQSQPNLLAGHIEWIHGNALQIDPAKGEAAVGFDRIYVGASVDKEDLPKLTRLLRPGGILVGPVEDELVKVVRTGSRRMSSSNTVMETDNDTSEFTQQVLSGVRFASLLQRPSLNTTLPSTVWNPSIHHRYPDSFRESCREILLCSNAKAAEQNKPQPNVAALLPRVLWMEILSYAHRDWFEGPETEVEFLRRRLEESQEATRAAHQARREAEARCERAQEERDVYRALARRYQTRLERVLGGRGSEEDGHQEDRALMSSREQAVIFGLGAMLRSIQYESGGDEDEEEDDDDDIDEEDGEDVPEAVQDTNDGSDMEDDHSINEQGNNAMMEEQESAEDDERDLEENATYFPLGTQGKEEAISQASQARTASTASIMSDDL